MAERKIPIKQIVMAIDNLDITKILALREDGEIYYWSGDAPIWKKMKPVPDEDDNINNK